MSEKQTMFQQQRHFMEACGQQFGGGRDQVDLYVNLVKEEFQELTDAWSAAEMAIGTPEFDAEAAIVETIDGAVDTMVVLYGILVSLEIDGDAELVKHLGAHESGCLFQQMAAINEEAIDLNGAIANQRREALHTMVELIYAEWDLLNQTYPVGVIFKPEEAEDMVRAVIYAISLCASMINALGINGPMAWNEVWSSNMTKLDPTTGKAIKREDGKILKPDSFRPANLLPVVKRSYGLEEEA